jgi:hypothetical protein
MLLILLGVVMTMSVAYADIVDHPDRISDVELFAALDLERPGLERVREAVQREDYAAAAVAWAEYFAAREQPTAHFDRGTWPDLIREHYPFLADPIVADADRIVAGEVGHSPAHLPVTDGVIDWSANPTRDTNYVGMVGSQWLLNCLGRAYLLTEDERYPEAFAWFFDSWYEAQPSIREHQGGLGFDPIFRAYYPGVRARVLADCYYCMASSPKLTPEIHLKLIKQLLGCAAWLAADNQVYKVGNQQVTAVLGCGIVGLMFPEFRDAEAWATLANQRMGEHLLKDFHPDGGHRELCTQYHKTVLRDVAYVALTSWANDRPSLLDDPAAAAALERAYDWLAALVMPTGETPALHSAVFATDWAVHLSLGAELFDRPDFAWLAHRFWQRHQAPSQKGPFGLANYIISTPPPDGGTPPASLSRHLDSSGFAVMRTGFEADDRYLVFQYGWANTGHAYPGALHLCLQMNGELIATSPGSPRSYRHPAYRYCHSTASHNVVSIDGESYPNANGIAPGGTLRAIADLPGAWYVRADHEGYADTHDATIERRVLVIKDGPVLISDRVTGADGHEARWSWHTPLTAEVGDDQTARLSGAASYSLIPARPDEVREVAVEEHWMAVLPRDCQPDDCGGSATALRWMKPIGPDGARFDMALFEVEGTIEPLGKRAFRLTAGDRAWLVLLPGGDALEVAGVAAAAECACVEMRAGDPVRAWVVSGTRLVVGGVEWLGSAEAVNADVNAP